MGFKVQKLLGGSARTGRGYFKYGESVLGWFMTFVKELWSFLKVRKKFWLLPMIIVLLLFGALIVLTSGTAVAPFIYTLF